MSYSKDVIKKIKDLNLPLGRYIVVGGSVLAVRGIREAKDLDLVVAPDVFEKLYQGGWSYDIEFEKKWNRKKLAKDDMEAYTHLYLERTKEFLNIAELINNADIIEGIPFQPLDHLIMAKLDTAREKDLKDVELIKEYLKK